MAQTDDLATRNQQEAAFINGLYDDALKNQNQTLEDNRNQNAGALDQEQQNVQQQTDAYQQRTDVEAQKGAQGYGNLSAGARQQAGLTLGNQWQKDASTLQNAQSQAEAEIERQRQLLASEYEAAIKEAQANNDMLRAQQLYEAAKREEERLRGYQRSAGNALAGQGDWSIVKNLYGLTDKQMAALQAYYETGNGDSTIPESLKQDAEALRKIYDSALEAQNQQLKAQYDQSYSDLKAKQLQQQQQTDQALTQAYVNSLKQGKNYNEVQSAYGMGSGTKSQANVTRQAGMQEDLTDLRKLQMGYDAQSGQDAYALLKGYLGDRADAASSSDLKFREALQDAYTDRKNQELADQEAAGKKLASGENDYSLLGKLWGLNQDQIDRLQQTGEYTPQVTPSRKKDYDVYDAIDAAVAAGGGKTEVNAIIDAAKADGIIDGETAAAIKRQYRNQIY